MPEFDNHSLEILEYGKIISLIHGLCLTPYGMSRVDQTQPLTDITAINRRLDEITEMKDIIRFGQAFPLYRLDDTRDLLSKSRVEGIFLEPLDLLTIRDLVEVGAGLHDYSREERPKFPLITEYLTTLHPFPEISREISKAIDHDGTVKDDASSKLKTVRREIGEMRRKIAARLEKILAERSRLKGWQDDTVTQRDGRYVIPIPSGQFKSDSGIIHDRSQSGATLFVEPAETVEMNNHLNLLHQEERLEVDRILRHLTSLVAAASERLFVNCDIIGQLDSLHASADMALKTEAERPLIKSSAGFNLIGARHPLLLYNTKDKSGIVANDIMLDGDRRGIIITGPNTGGKTVALKTVGLLAVMAQSGLHIPAHEKSTIGLFKNVIADIGDEQSIELSLSTFSSHIRQIIHAVRSAGPDTLVLLDEIGAGTDPKEGAALAESILLELSRQKARVMVTTHYSQLKTLPMQHPEFENASFEFDRKSLQPTFRLHTGIPGASYAVEIARRLGMPSSIADRAARLLGQGERDLSQLTESLEKDLAALKQDKAALEERLKKAAQLEIFYKTRQEQLEREIADSRKNRMEELDNLLDSTRLEVERTVREIRESKASAESVKKIHHLLRQGKDDLDRIRKKDKPVGSDDSQFKIGEMVMVTPFKKEGEIVEFIGQDKIRVRIENIMTTVGRTEIRKSETAAASDKSRTGSVGTPDDGPPPGELHLLGMTVEEAREELDKYFDMAELNGLTHAYIVHGKGTGALRKAVAEYLKGHRSVESYRLGDWNEGGAGVTIVHFKT